MTQTLTSLLVVGFSCTALLVGLLFVSGSSQQHSVAPFANNPIAAADLERAAAAQCRQRSAHHPQRTFFTDGCTAVPDGTWGYCCVAHDVVYWCGGSAEERLQADRALRQCVSERAGALVGALTYAGVRSGGHPIWPVRWRWGFGHDYAWGRYP